VLLVRPSSRKEGNVEIRWDLLPSFIAVQGDLHIRLAQALNDRFAGELTTSERDMREAHVFIACWLGERFPMFEGLDDWLTKLQNVQEQEVPPE